jgi:hypothetical protein
MARSKPGGRGRSGLAGRSRPRAGAGSDGGGHRRGMGADRDEGVAGVSWVKVDDQFFRNPKVMSAGRDARDLYLVGLCYCAQSLTDGFIPRAALRVLGAEAEIDEAQSGADRLVKVGLWELAAEGYMVHDYLEYQPTKERVLATREVRAEAGRRGGKQKASNLLDKTLAKPKQNSAPYPSRTPSPELTNPIAPEERERSLPLSDAPTPAPKRRAKRATPAPDAMPITVEMEEWAAANCPEVDLNRETRRFLDSARSKGREYADWSAAWRGWMTNDYPKALKGAKGARASPNGPAQNGFLASLERLASKDERDGPHDFPDALDAPFVVGPAHRRQQPGGH